MTDRLENTTTCPTCGAKCRETEESSCGWKVCDVPEHYVKALPQPDLTKLRKVYKEHVNLVEALANKAREGKVTHTEEVLDSMADVIHAIKEVLDAETSNSEHNRR